MLCDFILAMRLNMGLIRDAATEAVRDLVRSTVLVGGLTALSGVCAVAEGAVHAAGNIGHCFMCKHCC